jgi:hypothetical protein
VTAFTCITSVVGLPSPLSIPEIAEPANIPTAFVVQSEMATIPVLASITQKPFLDLLRASDYSSSTALGTIDTLPNEFQPIDNLPNNASNLAEAAEKLLLVPSAEPVPEPKPEPELQTEPEQEPQVEPEPVSEPELPPQPVVPVRVARHRVFDANAGVLHRSFHPFNSTYRSGLLAATCLLTVEGYHERISRPEVIVSLAPEVHLVPVPVAVPTPAVQTPEVLKAPEPPPLVPLTVSEPDIQPELFLDEPMRPSVIVTATNSQIAVYAGVANLIQTWCPLSAQSFVIGANIAPADQIGKGRWELAVGRRAGLVQVQVVGGILQSFGVDSSVMNGGERLAPRDYNRIGRAEVTTSGRASRISITPIFSGNGFCTQEDYDAFTQGLQTLVYVG